MSKEVIKGTDTIISCFITGLKIQANVTWLDSTNEAVSGPQFSSKEGFLENKQQIAQLKVAGSEVYADKSYTCRVTKTFEINDESETTIVSQYKKFNNIKLQIQYFNVHTSHITLVASANEARDSMIRLDESITNRVKIIGPSE